MNLGKDVDIIKESLSTEGKLLIKNNTSKTYIIDPLGFWGKIKYLENDYPAKTTYSPRGTFYRFSDSECERDLIVLRPFDKIYRVISLAKDFSGSVIDVKKISLANKYSYIAKSAHNKETLNASGCEKYVSDLELKGYKILDDSINVKVPIKLDFMEKNNL